jgi:predicted amidophosphoribosyltransferase
MKFHALWSMPSNMATVPLHWRRLWARRFNQSAILAAAVARQTGVPVAAGALKRVKPTAQQVGLSRAERAANIQGAALLRAGAANVDVLVFARVAEPVRTSI